MKQRSKKRTIIFALAAVLILAMISIPGTLAYFSDYDQASGSAQVNLTWQTELQEQVKDNNKHIQVKNVGETDVIVRAQIFAGDFVTVKDTEGNWTKAGDWWYYNGILKKGEVTTELFAEVKADKSATDDFNIVVVQESSRAVYESNAKLAAPDGWNAAAVSAIKVQ